MQLKYFIENAIRNILLKVQLNYFETNEYKTIQQNKMQLKHFIENAIRNILLKMQLKYFIENANKNIYWTCKLTRRKVLKVAIRASYS